MQAHAVGPAAAPDHRPDRVGELDLAVLARWGALEGFEDRGRQHVARRDRQVAGRLGGRGLLDQVVDLEQIATAERPGNPVVVHIGIRHLLEGDHRRRLPLDEAACHPSNDIAFGVHADDRIAQRDDERLVADEGPRAEHGMAQAERLPLAGVEVLHLRALELELLEQLLLAGLAQRLDELAVQVEVVLDRRFPGPGDEQHPLHADAGQLLDHVLHDRLAADRQHLLRL
jgi:hypothetical protein